MPRYKNVTFAVDPLVYQEIRVFAAEHDLKIKDLVAIIMLKWISKNTDTRQHEADSILEELSREANELKAKEKARLKLEKERAKYPAIDPVKIARAKARQLAQDANAF